MASHFIASSSSLLNDAWRPLFTQYTVSLYWAMETLVTVGYGDVVAHTDVERMFSCLVFLLGSFVYATIFGTVTMLVQQMSAATTGRNFAARRRMTS